MNLAPLNEYRQSYLGELGDNENGYFIIPTGPCAAILSVIAARGVGWEHVSVSTPRRCPNWREMEWVKKRTMGDVVAFQLHMPATDHINVHPYCLHMWHPLNAALPLPPKWMV